MRLLIALWTVAAAFGAEPFHEICGVCHTTAAEDFLSHPHASQGLDCNVCHGESVRHREAAGAAPPDRVAAPHQVPELCGGCHAEQGESFGGSAHGKLVAAKERAPHCGTCHDVHRVRPARAVERRCSNCHQELPQACSEEPPAGATAAVRCAACHAPHRFSPSI